MRIARRWLNDRPGEVVRKFGGCDKRVIERCPMVFILQLAEHGIIEDGLDGDRELNRSMVAFDSGC